MFCHRCGKAIEEDYRYCPTCGSELPSAIAAVSGHSRMEAHVKILAVAYIVYSAFSLVGSLGLLVAVTAVAAFLSRMLGLPSDAVGLIQGVVGSFGVLLVLESLAGLFGGFGMLQYRPWARTLAIILSLINLLHVPFGTLLGLYGLWVLVSTEGERHYQQMALEMS